MTLRQAQGERIVCSARLWRWTGATGSASWHFVTIEGAAREELDAIAFVRKLEGTVKGFGSLKVRAQIGQAVFETSLFPSKESGWMLPIKASVRRAEGIGEGDEVELVLEL